MKIIDQSEVDRRNRAISREILGMRSRGKSERQIRRRMKDKYGLVLTPDLKPYVK